MRDLARLIIVVILFSGRMASSVLAEDEIGMTLAAAKVVHAAAVQKARDALLVELEQAEESLDRSKAATVDKIKSLNQLKSDKEAFQDSWARPKNPLLKDASDHFLKDVIAARKDLEGAFDQAAEAYAVQKDLDSAEQVLAAKVIMKRRLAAIEEPQYVKITSAVSGKVIGVSQGALTPGTGLLQWRGAGVTDQTWQLIPVEDEWFLIRNRRSGLVMGVGGGSMDEGAAVIQWTRADVHDQHWKLELVKERGRETYMIVNRNSNKLVSLERESKDNGVKIIQCSLVENAPTQRWLLSK